VPADDKLPVSLPDDVDKKFDVDKSGLDTYDEDGDELKFRCSSALGDRAPPMTNAVEILTCEPIEWRPPRGDQLSPHGRIFDEPLPLPSEETRGFTSPADAESHSDHEADKDFRAVCDAAVSQSGQEDDGPEFSSKAVGVNPPVSVGGDCVDETVSCLDGFPHPEAEADFHGVVGKRVTSGRRCSRRKDKVYGGKRRRRSPHPSSICHLSLPPQPRPELWQPWQDDRSLQPTVEQGSSLQKALENLRCLSALPNTSSHHGASASAITTSATGNVTSFVSRMTSSATAMGK